MSKSGCKNGKKVQIPILIRGSLFSHCGARVRQTQECQWQNHFNVISNLVLKCGHRKMMLNGSWSQDVARCCKRFLSDRNLVEVLPVKMRLPCGAVVPGLSLLGIAIRFHGGPELLTHRTQKFLRALCGWNSFTKKKKKTCISYHILKLFHPFMMWYDMMWYIVVMFCRCFQSRMSSFYWWDLKSLRQGRPWTAVAVFRWEKRRARHHCIHWEEVHEQLPAYSVALIRKGVTVTYCNFNVLSFGKWR